jgi:acyl-CoA thioester hydrolase
MNQVEPLHLTGESGFDIFFEDTDFTGVVYHANYLKYCDRARELLIGLHTLKELSLLGWNFVVADAKIEFIKPLRFGDRVLVQSDTVLTRSPVNTYEHQLRTSSGLVARAVVRTVAIGTDGKPRRYIPEVIAMLSKK